MVILLCVAVAAVLATAIILFARFDSFFPVTFRVNVTGEQASRLAEISRNSYRASEGDIIRKALEKWAFKVRRVTRSVVPAVSVPVPARAARAEDFGVSGEPGSLRRVKLSEESAFIIRKAAERMFGGDISALTRVALAEYLGVIEAELESMEVQRVGYYMQCNYNWQC